MEIKKNLLSIIAILTFTICYSQGSITNSQENNLKIEMAKHTPTPKSPEAAAFQKYGDVPVNLYTGTPTISLPIYTIQGKEMSLPISLTYDASGIKVSQVASEVGLGWNLNHGGMITRTVNVLPDRSSGNNYKKIYGAYASFCKYLVDENLDLFIHDDSDKRNDGANFYNDYLINNVDYSADSFSFNVNGLSGTVVIDYHTVGFPAYCLDNDNIKVDYTLFSDEISGWTITDEGGTIYEFESTEKTFNSYSTLDNEFDYEFNSSWYLTKIISPNKKDTFEFNYSPLSTPTDNEQTLPSQTQSVNFDSTDNVTAIIKYSVSGTDSFTEYKIKYRELQSINYNFGDCIVNFSGSTNRLDVFDNNKRRLENITVYNSKNSKIKNINLYQTYFTANSSYEHPNFSEYNNRLKLDSLSYTTNDNTNPELKTYKFDYIDSDQMPQRLSNAIDFWGYYNGKHNTGNIPSPLPDENHRVLEMQTAYGHSFPIDGDIIGSNLITNPMSSSRFPDFNFAQKGTLNKITYPTGGITNFYYQSPKGSSSSYIEEDQEFIIYNFSLDGGWAWDNTNEYCDIDAGVILNENDDDTNNNGVFWDDSQSRNNNVFTINSSTGSADIKLVYTKNVGTPDPVNQQPEANYDYVWIYRAIPPLSGSIPSYIQSDYYQKTKCELKNGSNTYKIFGPESPQFDGERTINLPNGTYRIKMGNGIINSTTTLNVYKNENIAHTIENTVGGMRVYKIEDKTNEEETASIKYYYYKHYLPAFVENGLTTLTENYVDGVFYNQGASDALIQQKLKFFTSSFTDKIVINFETNLLRDVVKEFTLSSQNLAKQSRYKITYYTVNEVEFLKDENDLLTPNQITRFTFKNSDEGSFTNTIKDYRDLLNGKLLKTEYLKYKTGGNLPTANGYHIDLVKSIENVYSNDAIEPNSIYKDFIINESSTQATPNIAGSVCRTLDDNGTDYYTVFNGMPDSSPNCPQGGDFNFYKHVTLDEYLRKKKWQRLDRTIVKDYFDDDIITTTTKNYYDNLDHRQLTRIEVTTSKDITSMVSKIDYAHDMLSLGVDTSIMQELIDANRTALPIQTASYKKESTDPVVLGTLQNKKRTTYFKDLQSNLILPEIVSTAKGSDNLEDRIIYHKYDIKGNPLEVSLDSGQHVSYIWGYGNQFVVAKIVNTNYDNIDPTIISQIKTKSTSGTESELLSKLINLRNSLPDAMITSYTYFPLIGVSTITDVKGELQRFEYDDFNRLQFIKDRDGNILKENNYRYRDPNSNGGTTTPTCDDLLSGTISIVPGPIVIFDPAVTYTREFNVSVSGGSGNYTYLWEIINQNGVVQTNGVSNDTTFYSVDYTCVNMNGDSNVYVTCTIIDDDNPNTCPLVFESNELSCN